MEDWGAIVEVEESYKVVIPEGKALYLAGATLLNPNNKDTPPVYTYSAHHKHGNKHPLVCLIFKTHPSVSIDVVYSKTFFLSHDSQDGPVAFRGFMADNPDSDPEPTDKKRDLGSASGYGKNKKKLKHYGQFSGSK